MKFSSILVLAALLLTGSLTGYAANGSLYSRYGVGELTSFMSGRSIGMGRTGLAILSDGAISRTNPAALSRIGFVRLEADFQYRGYSMNDGTGTSYLSSGNFQSFMVAFPILRKSGLVFAAGVTPFSSVAYAVNGPETVNSLTLSRMAEGSGGLTDVQAALSYSPFEDLSLGLAGHYLFGKIDHKQSLTFTAGEYFASNSDRTISAGGGAVTLGASLTGLDKALGLSTEKNVNLAAAFFTGGSLSATEKIIDSYVTVKDTSVGARKGSIEIPYRGTIGLAYLLHERTIIAADAEFSDWSQYKEFGVHPSEFRNSMRLGAGMDFLAVRGPVESYWDQLSYRFGAYYQETNLKINNEPINEYFLTGGFSFPFSSAGGESRLNVALEYGIRGTTSAHLEKDSIFRMTFSFTANELSWFNPPVVE